MNRAVPRYKISDSSNVQESSADNDYVPPRPPAPATPLALPPHLYEDPNREQLRDKLRAAATKTASGTPDTGLPAGGVISTGKTSTLSLAPERERATTIAMSQWPPHAPASAPKTATSLRPAAWGSGYVAYPPGAAVPAVTLSAAGTTTATAASSATGAPVKVNPLYGASTILPKRAATDSPPLPALPPPRQPTASPAAPEPPSAASSASCASVASVPFGSDHGVDFGSDTLTSMRSTASFSMASKVQYSQLTLSAGDLLQWERIGHELAATQTTTRRLVVACGVLLFISVIALTLACYGLSRPSSSCNSPCASQGAAASSSLFGGPRLPSTITPEGGLSLIDGSLYLTGARVYATTPKSVYVNDSSTNTTEWNPATVRIGVADTVVWSWPNTSIDAVYQVNSSASNASAVPGGISSGDPIEAGSFSYQFLKPGRYLFRGAISARFMTVVVESTQLVNAAFQRGMVLAWSGLVESIPDGFALCDGTNGTPDLRGRFILGADMSTVTTNTTGGAANVSLRTSHLPSHAHAATSTFSGNPLPSHNHGVNDPGHSHSMTGVYTKNIVRGTSSTTSVADATGSSTSGSTTGISLFSSSAGTPSGTVTTTVLAAGDGAAFSILPPYYAFAYIMKL